LREHHQLTHRQPSRPKTARAKPKSLCASGPNQVYSWDITYLPTTVKGIFFYLYLFMDVFSRKIVGWQVYETESSEQAARDSRKPAGRHQRLVMGQTNAEDRVCPPARGIP
jgi:transposase InsO family protein